VKTFSAVPWAEYAAPTTASTQQNVVGIRNELRR
jgi:hypothetical protein